MASQKRTSETYQQYVQDLHIWKKKIKEQEKNLSKDGSLIDKTYPSIRPSAEILFGATQNPTQVPVSPEKISKIITRPETKGINKKKTEKIKAFDYRAWDKFDVDKVLEESDESDTDQQQTNPISSTLSNKPALMSKQRQPDRKGKKTYRLEQALQEKETGNTYFKKGDYTNAIVHYGKAMELDPKEAVYFINRAMAYLKLRKWKDAESDCTVGLMLHPDNSKAFWRRGIARRELGKLEEAKKDLQEALRLEPNDKAVKEELDKVLNAMELVNPTSKVPRRRLSIEEVDFDEDDIIESKKINSIKSNEKINGNNKPIENPKKTTPKKFKAPQSVIEFESDWTVQQSNEDLYHYIKVIPPSSYPSLLSNLLEVEYISQISVILKDFYLIHDTVNDIYDILYNLSRVERFSLVIGFLEKEDKKVLETLFEDLIKSRKDTQFGVDNLENFTRGNVLELAQAYHIRDLE